MARHVVTNLRFSEQTYRELRYTALRRGVSVASVVRESVDRYLGRTDEDKPIPFGMDPYDKHIGSMYRLGINTAFTFDRDFRDCGFQMIP